VSVLVTSRQRVGVSGEVVYKLRPLAIPVKAVASLTEAQTYASVDLFIRQAMASEHPVSFTNGNAVAVADICRVLDGLPLSIELAAARAGTLGLGPLAGRLREGLEPVNVNRDAPPRHRTSLASLNWSYRLLTSGEQRVFEQLSVFPGTFTLEEAEGECAGAGIDESSVSEALSSLVEKNLVEVDASGASTYHAMLNTVRRFASRMRLDSVANVP
jgi:predicted ATPase